MQSNNLSEVIVRLLLVLLMAVMCLWFGYWSPRWRAFKSGERAVPVWFGAGTLLLWNPGETFVFQKNKKLEDIGDSDGGMRTVFWFRGQQYVGPIPLRTGLLDWEDMK